MAETAEEAVLVTWVGRRDPWWLDIRTEQLVDGPVLDLLNASLGSAAGDQGEVEAAPKPPRFRSVYLLSTAGSATDLQLDELSERVLPRLLEAKVEDPQYRPLYRRLLGVDLFSARATGLQRHAQRRFREAAVRIRTQPVSVSNPTNYEELFHTTQAACGEIRRKEEEEASAGPGGGAPAYYAYLQPGTGQMQTVWWLLSASGLFPARLLATVEPRYRLATDAPVFREVSFDVADFPQVVTPSAYAQRVRALESTVASLRRERDELEQTVRRLLAERAAREALRGTQLPGTGGGEGAGHGAGGGVPALAPGQTLREYLEQVERLFYARAFQEAGGSPRKAAELLGGLEEHAVAKRAVSFGLYERGARPPRRRG